MIGQVKSFSSIFCLVTGLLFSVTSFAELKILTNEEPPTNYLQNNVPTGICVDIVNAIREKLDVKEEVQIWPWTRAFELASSTPNVVLFTAGRTEAREPNFHWVGPLTTRNQVLYSSASHSLPQIESLDAIKASNYQIGGLRDDWRALYFKKRGFEVVEVNSHKQNLNLLLEGRIQLWSTSDLESPFIMHDLGIEHDKIKASFIYASDKTGWLMISKGTPQPVVEQWQAAYEEMGQDGTLDKIASKWAKITNRPINFKSNKGIFAK